MTPLALNLGDLLRMVPLWVWLLLIALFVGWMAVIWFSSGYGRLGRGADAAELATRERETSSVWATRRTIKALLVPGAHVTDPRQQRLGYLGKDLVASEVMASEMVVAPTRSMKTASVVVPNVLDHEGPLLCGSVKPDVMNLTRAYRETQGPVWLFDPSRSTGTTARWSPLATVRDWSDALDSAKWLQDSSKVEKRGLEDREFWDANARKVLAPLIMLAASQGGTMRDVTRWAAQVSSLEQLLGEEIQALGIPEAFDYWTSYAELADKTKSSVNGTLFVVLEAWGHPKVAAAVDVTGGDPSDVLQLHDLLDRNGTLYLVAPASQQALFTPIYETLVNAVIMDVERRYAATGKPVNPPLFLCLDEAANIAPLRNLDKIASVGAGMGIKVLTVWQDGAQIHDIYGPEKARTIVSNHINKVFLSGISDSETLEDLSRLIGDTTVERVTSSSDGLGRVTLSTQYHDVRVAPAEWLRQLPAFTAVVIARNFPPMRLTTKPWFNDAEMRKRIDPAVAKEFDDYFAPKPGERKARR